MWPNVSWTIGAVRHQNSRGEALICRCKKNPHDSAWDAIIRTTGGGLDPSACKKIRVGSRPVPSPLLDLRLVHNLVIRCVDQEVCSGAPMRGLNLAIHLRPPPPLVFLTLSSHRVQVGQKEEEDEEEEEEESVVDTVQVCCQSKLTHAQFALPASPCRIAHG
nr:unnamed protein product [Spirometra erinaceieuropaei]